MTCDKSEWGCLRVVGMDLEAFAHGNSVMVRSSRGLGGDRAVWRDISRRCHGANVSNGRGMLRLGWLDEDCAPRSDTLLIDPTWYIARHPDVDVTIIFVSTIV